MKSEEMTQNETVTAAEQVTVTTCEKNAEEKMEKLENSVNSVIEENVADGHDGHDGTDDDAETEGAGDKAGEDPEGTVAGEDPEGTVAGEDAEGNDNTEGTDDADDTDEEHGDESCCPADDRGCLPTSGDEHIDAVLLQMAQEQEAGAWSEATITLLRRALNYDADVAKARHEGEVAGRNVRIREFLIERREPEGIYNLSGGGSALAHDVPTERLGGLAAAERPNIWQRGGERRRRRN